MSFDFFCGFFLIYTKRYSNIAMAGKWGPRIEPMYFLLKMGIFHPATLVYQRVIPPPPKLREKTEKEPSLTRVFFRGIWVFENTRLFRCKLAVFFWRLVLFSYPQPPIVWSMCFANVGRLTVSSSEIPKEDALCGARFDQLQ